MQKHSWNKIHCNLKSSSYPTPRWGHSCCLIDETIVYFGGYADSSYMNDVWTFNTLTMDWTQVQTFGDIPSNRSNCSMSYDKQNNKIIVYGGGAPNKRRFNTIHLLDWKKKQWTEILPKQNQSAPWERTYHTAELFYPYLLVFGGEAMTDLDDLWAFNFQSLSWTQITLEEDSPKPCARRFHSSCKKDNQFFIIAGCHGKYRCLNDIYSMDVTELLQKGNTKLKWKQRKIKGNTFLTRWGHSSTVFDDKIYIFGGRFSNDLNDMLVVDLEKEQMKAMKTNIQIPKARRRHSACFVGSSMVIFGGFNGEYFNDLHYINVLEAKKKVEAKTFNCLPRANYSSFLNNWSMSDGAIVTLNKDQIPVHRALIRRYFSSEEKMEEFLEDLESGYSKQQVIEILSYLYRGYGQEQFDSSHLSLSENYEIQLPQSENLKELQFFKKLFSDSKQFLSIAPKKSNIVTAPVIYLAEDQYINFLQAMRSQMYCDASIVFNNQYCLPISKSLVRINSEYFNAIFSPDFSQNDEIHLHWECSKTTILVYEVLVNYLALGRVIISKEYELEHWVQLIQLANYYSLSHLVQICEQELLTWVNYNCQKLMDLSLKLNLKNLGMHCAGLQIKMMVNKEEKYQIDYQESENQKLNVKRERLLKEVYGLLRFDILQSRIEAENRLECTYKKKQTECEEKENYENNFAII